MIFLTKTKQQKIIQRQHKISNLIKSKNNFYVLQDCKKHTSNTFPNKLVPISKNIIKEKSKLAISLTERTFIYEIEDKYDQESKLKVYPKFFTDRCDKIERKLIV